MTIEIQINGRTISDNNYPFLIAEISGNHNGSIDNAFDLIKKAKTSGADAVKIQTYTADTITLKSEKPDFQIEQGLWKGRTLHDLYHWAHTPWDWHKALFDYAHEIGITIFSSPFDRTAVDLLESLNTPAYKIASFEIIDLPLISYIASTKKPMIISTGMADATEIDEAIDTALSSGCKQLALLHCVSGYPAPIADYNLRTLADMKKRFKVPVGLSDHTLDGTVALASIALGACIVEKHFTLDKNAGGPDDSFSIEPKDFHDLASQIKKVFQAIGEVDYNRKSSEVENIKFRRSLYFVKNMEKGELITEDSVRSVRPGYGLPPKLLANVIGRKTSCKVEKNSAVSWDLIS